MNAATVLQATDRIEYRLVECGLQLMVGSKKDFLVVTDRKKIS